MQVVLLSPLSIEGKYCKFIWDQMPNQIISREYSSSLCVCTQSWGGGWLLWPHGL